MHAIETRYKRIMFRSRLEAKWAAMFDNLGWPWEYEPIDLAGYIPDFVLPFDHAPIIVEVKPILSRSGFDEYQSKIERAGWDNEALIVGARVFDVDFWGDSLSIGELAERLWGDEDQERPPEWCWDQSFMFRCRECNRISFAHTCQSWFCRVNGCYDGNRHLSFDDIPVREAWAEAHNVTQWRR